MKTACDILLKRRQEGRLGDPETARTALDYVVAISINAQPAAEKGDAWKHVGALGLAMLEVCETKPGKHWGQRSTTSFSGEYKETI